MGYSGDRTAGGRGPSLFINFLPVRFRGQATAGVVPFESADQLHGLSEQHRGSHVVLRDRNEIVCVPVAEGAEQVGERRVVTSTAPDVALQARLLNERLKRILTEQWNYELRRESPVRFVSRVAGRDLLEQALGKGINGLHVYPEYSLDVRRSGPREYSGIVIGMKARYEIDVPVNLLLRRGVQVVGVYVVAESESESVRVWPSQDVRARRKLVGRVAGVDGDKLVVQSREGEVKIDAAQAWIESTKANFHSVLQKVCGRSFERDLAALDNKIAAFNNAERRITDTDTIAGGLLRLRQFDIAVGMTVDLARPLRLAGDQVPHVRTLSEPTFVFDQSGDKTDRYPDSGLTKFGPLDAESFTPKAPRIAVVVPRQFQGRVETLLGRVRRKVVRWS